MVTGPGISLEHLGLAYAESLSGKADVVVARGVLKGLYFSNLVVICI
jgi:hypothetical protein